MAKVRFTAGRVRDFECQNDRRSSFLWDAGAPGLGLRVTPNRAKSFIFQAKLDGNVIRITIGDSITWDVSSAQAEANRLRVMVDNGLDPRQVKEDVIAADEAARRARKESEVSAAAAKSETALWEKLEFEKQTLLARTVWDAYLGARHMRWGPVHYKDHLTAALEGGKTKKIGNGQTKPGPLASLLNHPLHSISASVVRDWLAEECISRPTSAHNAYRKFRTFVQWCAKQSSYRDVVQSECCLSDDVKDIVPRNKTKEGDCLQREQLSAWFMSIRRIHNPVISAYLQGLLITGARREELAQLLWKDVDFKWRGITIRDKVEGTRTIPLTPYLAALLDTLPKNNKWVFSSQTAVSGRLTEPRIAHTKALAHAGLPHVSLHGLRRSFGTLCEWIEVPSGVSAQIMGHKPSALVEKHYRRRSLDLLRMWHDKIEKWMLEQAGVN